MSETKPNDTQPKIDPEKIHLAAEHKLTRPLTSCFWEPGNRFILLGLQDNGIVRFDLKSHDAVAMRGPHDSWVRAIATSPDGQMAYSGGYDGRLVWWPTGDEKPEPIRAVDAHQGWIRALAVSPDGSRLATCGNDQLVRLWDASSGELVSVFKGHQSHVYNVVFAPGGNRLISCDLKGFVKSWEWGADGGVGDKGTQETQSSEDLAAVSSDGNATQTQLEMKQDLVHLESLHKYDPTFRADIGGARCVSFSQDGRQLAIGGITNVTNAFAGVGEAVVALIDAASGEVVVQYAPQETVRGTTWGIAHHPDDFWIGLTGGGGGGWFYFWRGKEPAEFFKLKLKNDGRGMSLAPDGRQVAVAHADQHLRLYTLHAEPTA